MARYGYSLQWKHTGTNTCYFSKYTDGSSEENLKRICADIGTEFNKIQYFASNKWDLDNPNSSNSNWQIPIECGSVGSPSTGYVSNRKTLDKCPDTPGGGNNEGNGGDLSFKNATSIRFKSKINGYETHPIKINVNSNGEPYPKTIHDYNEACIDILGYGNDGLIANDVMGRFQWKADTWVEYVDINSTELLQAFCAKFADGGAYPGTGGSGALSGNGTKQATYYPATDMAFHQKFPAHNHPNIKWQFYGYIHDDKDTPDDRPIEMTTTCFTSEVEAKAAVQEMLDDNRKSIETIPSTPPMPVTVMYKDQTKISPCVLEAGTDPTTEVDYVEVFSASNFWFKTEWEDGSVTENIEWTGFKKTYFNKGDKYEFEGLDQSTVVTEDIKEQDECVGQFVPKTEQHHGLMTIYESRQIGVEYVPYQELKKTTVTKEIPVTKLVEYNYVLESAFAKIYRMDIKGYDKHYLKNITFECLEDLDKKYKDGVKVAFRDKRNLWYYMDDNHKLQQIEGDSNRLFHEMDYTLSKIDSLNFWKNVKLDTGEVGYLSVPERLGDEQFVELAFYLPLIKPMYLDKFTNEYDALVGDIESTYVTPDKGNKLMWRMSKASTTEDIPGSGGLKQETLRLLLKGLTLKWGYEHKEKIYVDDYEWVWRDPIMGTEQRYIPDKTKKIYTEVLNIEPSIKKVIVPALISPDNYQLLPEKEVDEQYIVVPEGNYEITKEGVYKYWLNYAADKPGGGYEAKRNEITKEEYETYVASNHCVEKEVISLPEVSAYEIVIIEKGGYKWVEYIVTPGDWYWTKVGGHWVNVGDPIDTPKPPKPPMPTPNP